MKGGLVLLLLALPLLLFGQVAPERYWIQFTDKDNTPYSVSSPEAFLSARAIARRQRQHIAIVESDLPVDPDYIAQVQAAGAELLNVSKWMNGIVVRITSDAVLQQVLALPFVAATEPVGKQLESASEWKKGEVSVNAKSLATLPTDEDYGTAFNQIDMLRGVALHRQGLMGQGMCVAVLDAGFSGVDQLAVFDSLRLNNRIVATRDFVDGDQHVYGHHTHGMAVLSTMAAYMPGTMIGTAPKASYMLLRTEDAGSEFPIEEYNWVAGAEFADSAGADIFNTSLGYNTFDDPAYDHVYADLDGHTTVAARGSNMAASKGILVVTSAGNEGNSSWKFISTPADADSALAIGAVTADEQYATFSSIGPGAAGQIKPNVCAQGHQAVVATSSGGFSPGNGTSFAGPIMAGMAACLWQGFPDSSNMAVFDAIQRSAHLFNAPTDEMGHGIPDFMQARLLLTGHVPVNVNKDEFVTMFPSPFTDRLEGTYYSASVQELEFRLVNVLGQTIQTLRGDGCGQCVHTFRFDGLAALPIGNYYVQALARDEQRTIKVVKVE